MCGIAGIVSPRLPTGAVRIACEMVAQIAHRGPDAQAVVHDEHCVFGHALLAIAGGDASRQPMSDDSGQHWISYNGEIYNGPELQRDLESLGNRFRRGCDTEIVLAALRAWGDRAVERFNGGFALAYYDRATAAVLLARDEFGKRPLYYTQSGGVLAFASEVKAFLALPWFSLRYDEGALATLYWTSAVTAPETVFQGICQVGPGECVWIRNGRISRTPARRRPAHRYPGSRADAMHELQHRIATSVRRRAQANRPVTVLASGGLDSSIVATELAADAARRVTAYSIAFPNTEYDESAAQEAVCASLGLAHRRIVVTPATIAAGFRDALYHAEQPIPTAAPIPMYHLARQLHADGYAVALSGEGADEMFLGYGVFREVLLRGAIASRPTAVAAADLAAVYGGWSESVDAAVHSVARRFPNPQDLLHSHLPRYYNNKTAASTLAQGMSFRRARDLEERTYADLAGFDPITRARALELSKLLAGYLLSVQGDRMAMAWGVENRCPFLDADVVALAVSLPHEWHLPHNGPEKKILRDAYRNRLPGDLVDRAKRSYLAPDVAFVQSRDADPLFQEFADALGKDELPWASRPHGEYLLARRNAARQDSAILPYSHARALLLLLSTFALERNFATRKGASHRRTIAARAAAVTVTPIPGLASRVPGARGAGRAR